MSEQNWTALSDDVRGIWNANAAFWDDYMKEGNDFQQVLISPTEERLLDLKGGEQILDVACGNGNFARRLAALGARVVACDFSEVFIERARARTVENANPVEYRVVDATQRDQLLALGEQRFDAITCNMALMDMSDIAPLLQAIPRLLKPSGCFVFSIMHPCFNSSYASHVAEQEDRNGELVTEYAIKVHGYSTPLVSKGLGVIGQPVAQYYFHRSISLLLNACFNAGMVLDRVEEPCFPATAQPNRPFSWANFRDIPPVLIARLRLRGRK